MVRAIDETGNRYGRLTVEALHDSIRNRKRWRCECDCGGQVMVIGTHLRNGNTTSCGCAQRERAAESNRARAKHGHTTDKTLTSTYGSWVAMRKRAANPSNPHYGGRGITVCDRWLGLNGFPNFLADMGERPDGTSIDRIDPDGNYEPENCRWANASTQRRNRRT